MSRTPEVAASSVSTASEQRYSPHRRTALVLTGTGTAGAYHAGVLRVLHEAGVKVDLVAGRGVGAVGAAFAAVDGAHTSGSGPVSGRQVSFGCTVGGVHCG